LAGRLVACSGSTRDRAPVNGIGFLPFITGRTVARKADFTDRPGITERPTPVFWRELDTPDKF
jgi:hypothetical protein